MDRPRERARRGRSVADQAWLPCIEGLLQSRLLAASKIRVLVDLLGTDHSAPVDLSPPLRGGEVTNLGYDALRVHPCPDQSPALGSVRGCSHHPDPPLSGSESSGSSPTAAKMRETGRVSCRENEVVYDMVTICATRFISVYKL